MFRYLELRYFS